MKSLNCEWWIFTFDAEFYECFQSTKQGKLYFAADINDKVTDELQALKSSKAIKDWRSKVLGGGRIKHDPGAKTINVYGYSQVTNLHIRKKLQVETGSSSGKGSLSGTASWEVCIKTSTLLATCVLDVSPILDAGLTDL